MWYGLSKRMRSRCVAKNQSHDDRTNKGYELTKWLWIGKSELLFDQSEGRENETKDNEENKHKRESK